MTRFTLVLCTLMCSMPSLCFDRNAAAAQAEAVRVSSQLAAQRSMAQHQTFVAPTTNAKILAQQQAEAVNRKIQAKK